MNVELFSSGCGSSTSSRHPEADGSRGAPAGCAKRVADQTVGATAPESAAAALRGAAAVVGLRRDVLDRADLEAGGRQRADRGLAARTRTLHEDVDLLDAVLLRLTRSG